jgi:RNA 2',3'-cyclic 3'-phosphodiesterase
MQSGSRLDSEGDLVIRAFVAVEIPEDLRAALTSTIGALERLGIDARMSRPESIHLTLKFLGDIEEAQIGAIESTLREVLEDRSTFPVRIGGLGAFPYLANARVVWVGVDGGEALSQLQHRVDTGLSKLGFVPEKRKFKPHLTLARVKSRHNIAALIHYVESARSLDLGEFTARQLHLFRSILRPDGARYSKLVSLDFG